jgi:hypothetical protein
MIRHGFDLTVDRVAHRIQTLPPSSSFENSAFHGLDLET